jgi:predicted nucleic acid-binding protein
VTVAFVDTGAWIALSSQKDAFHSRAREFFRTIARDTKLMTSNYVISETVTYLAYHKARAAALTLWRAVEESERSGLLDLVWVTPAVHRQAWEVFRHYDDQTFSFCDCASIAISQEKRVDYVFGFDSDFLKAGLDLRPGLRPSTRRR